MMLTGLEQSLMPPNIRTTKLYSALLDGVESVLNGA